MFNAKSGRDKKDKVNLTDYCVTNTVDMLCGFLYHLFDVVFWRNFFQRKTKRTDRNNQS